MGLLLLMYLSWGHAVSPFLLMVQRPHVMTAPTAKRLPHDSNNGGLWTLPEVGCCAVAHAA